MAAATRAPAHSTALAAAMVVLGSAIAAEAGFRATVTAPQGHEVRLHEARACFAPGCGNGWAA